MEMLKDWTFNNSVSGPRTRALSKAAQLPESDSNDETQGPSSRMPLYGATGPRRWVQRGVFSLLRSAALINGIALAIIVGFLLYNGWSAINWTFLSQVPTDSMTKGGILPCIVGTFLLSFGAMLVAFPWGIASAIYLHEYARPGPALRVIRLGISNLAGVPSVVFGLFGLAFFVTWCDLGVSILSGVLTLGVLVLPVIIGTAEEALRAVPATYREASLALGSTKWQTIYRVVLPAALPGMLTGSILGISRAAGETAAIMFTAAVFFTRHLPGSPFDPVMALPYHIYVLATAGTNIEATRPLQYGSALVLVALVFGMNLIAIYCRARMQRAR
ncbi:MAG: phosphate ABC transporter permease PstA [Syntrophobacteraceae bacterium]